MSPVESRPLFRPLALVGFALAAGALVAPARAELAFGPPQFLPGDDVPGPPVGMQTQADVSWGDGQYLAVWSDGRSTPDDYWPFATEGSGTDVYGARLDSSGNLIDLTPFVIHQGFGDQDEPGVAWNGQNWLVVWKSETTTLPTYERVQAVRVAPDGTVLDPSPILVHDDQSNYDWDGSVVEGGSGEWIVAVQANGPVSGLIAVRILGDGTVANPGGLHVYETNFGLDFDVAFAGDEYLFVWGGSFDPARGRRYTPDLQVLGTTGLPFAGKVDTDGTDFLVAAARGSAPLATVEAFRITHDGAAFAPFTLYNGSNQEGTCCEGVTWDGTYYWVSWGGPRFARVTAAGEPRDPTGFPVTPPRWPISQPQFVASPGGGLQMVYNDGPNGAAYPKDVYAARILADGTLGSETLASRGAPAQLGADFAVGAGVNVVAFRSRLSDTGRILVQRLDDQGVALDAEPREAATGPVPGVGLPSLGDPGVAWNGSVFLITWSDGLEIFARRMLSDGTFLDATPLNVMAGHDPDVAAVGDAFLVVGLDLISGNPHWQATFSMRVDGTTGENLDASSSPIGGFAIFARHPHVVSWGGRWLAVWQRNLSHDDTIAGTTAAFVNPDGTTPGLIDVPLGWRPDVAVSEDRALFVAVTNTIASATTDLAGIVMDPNGTFLGGSFLISAAADKQLMPTATWNGSEFVAAWEDKRNSNIYFDERTDVYGARVASDGTVLDPAGVSLAARVEPEVEPALASIGGASLLAVSTLIPDAPYAAYRLGIQTTGGAPTGVAGFAPSGLLGAYPNPSRSSTTIRFAPRDRGPVSLRVYDAAGRLVRTLVESETFEPSGAPVAVSWDGRDANGASVRSGVFFYRLQTTRRSENGKVLILR